MANLVRVDALGTVGDKKASAAIAFGDALERSGAKTVRPYMSKLISDCETQWAAEANVTPTVEATIKKVGSGSAKLAIAAGFTTGLAAHIDFAALDLSTYTRIGFWIRSSVAQAAGALTVGLGETASGASLTCTWNVPALVAGIWKYVELEFVGATSTRDVLISLALTVVTDNGACDIYIDDVRAGTNFVGVADDDLKGDSYVQYDPVAIIDEGKVNVTLVGTCTTGQNLIPVGNGKWAVDGGDALEIGIDSVRAKGRAIEDQATAGGQVPMRLK